MPVTFAYEEGVDGEGNRRGIRKIIATWTTDGAGNASGTSAKVVGTLVKATTVPTNGPTDNYDIVITDGDGVNVLAGCDDDLIDRDTTNPEEIYFLVKDHAAGTPLAQSLHPVVCSPLTVTVAVAGSTKTGVVNLYLKD